MGLAVWGAAQSFPWIWQKTTNSERLWSPNLGDNHSPGRMSIWQVCCQPRDNWKKIPSLGKHSQECRVCSSGQVGKPELLFSLSYGRGTEIAMKSAWGQSFWRVSLPCITAQGCTLCITKHGVYHQQPTAAEPWDPWEIDIYSFRFITIICVSADIIRRAVFSKATVLWTAEVGRSQNCSQKKLSFEPSSSFVPSIPPSCSSKHKCSLQPRFWTNSEKWIQTVT